MSAPATERQRSSARVRGATIPAQRGARAVTVPAQPTRRRAAGGTDRGRTATRKAYARRDERARRHVGAPRSASPSGRPQFVLVVMVLLAAGLVATLWLSTAAAADSYRLQDAKVEARELAEQSARLHRDVATMDSAPVLAERARGLGLVPVQDPARLVVLPGGAVEVVGEPVPARGPEPEAAPDAGAEPDAGDPTAEDGEGASPPSDDTADEPSGEPADDSGDTGDTGDTGDPAVQAAGAQGATGEG